jgi:hypothetical protein
MMGWPTLNSPEDADATHRWARACLEMWEAERAALLAENARLRRELADTKQRLEHERAENRYLVTGEEDQ